MKTKTAAPFPVREEKPATPRRRVFLVDDHPITREGVRGMIDQENDLIVCGEADGGPSTMKLLQQHNPDIAIIDISLKTTNGLELLKNIKALMPDLLVLMMSMYDEGLYAERSLRAGARGYVMKHEASSSILSGVRAVLNGDIYLSERMKEKMLQRLVRSKKEEVVFTIDTLSDREMEVFQLIGNGFATRQIAQKLNLSVKTIDSYREHLKLKLRLERGADLVRHAIQWMRTESMAAS